MGADLYPIRSEPPDRRRMCSSGGLSYRPDMTSTADRALAAIRRRSVAGRVDARGVDVHFQPDAQTTSGVPVLQALVADGVWRTQFETATSNGGLTAFRGGDRRRWESRLFDGSYDEAPPEERPVYAALRMTDDAYGSAPRFGSALLRVRAEVLRRSTLCFPDSVFEPDAVGTLDRAGAVIEALGAVDLADPLDRYVEVHVHGGIRLAEDVESVVLDPSFRGGAIATAAERSGLRVEWHPGYALEPDRIAEQVGYRGQPIVDAAIRVARGGTLTPAVLGEARRDRVVDPQTAKRIWHLLAAFGRRG